MTQFSTAQKLPAAIAEGLGLKNVVSLTLIANPDCVTTVIAEMYVDVEQEEKILEAMSSDEVQEDMKGIDVLAVEKKADTCNAQDEACGCTI